MTERVIAQLMSRQNIDYLKTLINDIKRAEMEAFIEANQTSINCKLSMWENVRLMNTLFMRKRSVRNVGTPRDDVYTRFMSAKNVEYLRGFTKLPEKEHLVRVFEFRSNDAAEILESYGDLMKSPNTESQLELLNGEFIKGYGNMPMGEDYAMEQFIHDSLAPPGYEHFNAGPNGTLYTGQKMEAGDYEGNKMNLFSTYPNQRRPGIPFWQVHTGRKNIDRDIDETLGMAHTEYDREISSKYVNAYYDRYAHDGRLRK